MNIENPGEFGVNPDQLKNPDNQVLDKAAGFLDQLEGEVLMRRGEDWATTEMVSDAAKALEAAIDGEGMSGAGFGYYIERIVALAERYGLNVTRVEDGHGETITISKQ